MNEPHVNHNIFSIEFPRYLGTLPLLWICWILYVTLFTLKVFILYYQGIAQMLHLVNIYFCLNLNKTYKYKILTKFKRLFPETNETRIFNYLSFVCKDIKLWEITLFLKYLNYCTPGETILKIWSRWSRLTNHTEAHKNVS